MFKERLKKQTRKELLIYLERLSQTHLALVRSAIFQKKAPPGLILAQVESWLIQINRLTIALEALGRAKK